MNFDSVPRRNAGIIGSSVEYLPTVTSTNDFLLSRASYAEGTVVVTDLQTAGRGRGDHRWTAPAGENLLFSFSLTVDSSDATFSLLPVLTSLSVCEGLDAAGIAGTQAKWPNDIVSDGKKLCGILIECRVRGPSARAVVGVGLNVNQTTFPPELSDIATSIALIAARPFDRRELLGRILDSLNMSFFHHGRHEAVRRYEQRCATVGKTITFELEGRRRSGRACGIDERGRLLVEEAGGIIAFAGSEVTHVRNSQY